DVISRIEPPAEPSVALTIVQAVLKGDKMDGVVRDAAMLGAAAIQPVVTKRTEATLTALRAGARLDRWRRIVIASIKQSRRAVVPEVRAPMALDRLLEEPTEPLRLMLIEPAASDVAEPVSALRDELVPRAAGVIVGPEGGWAQSEIDTARARG